MKNALNQLAYAVLQKNSLQEYNLAELKQLTSLHPYSSVLQLLLAAKLRTEEDSDFPSQLEITALHIPDAARLEHILSQKGSVQVESKKKEERATSRLMPIQESVSMPEPINEFIDDTPPLPAREPEEKDEFSFGLEITPVEKPITAEPFKELTSDNPPLPVWQPEKTEEPFLDPVMPTNHLVQPVQTEKEWGADTPSDQNEEPERMEQPVLPSEMEDQGQDMNEKTDSPEAEQGMPVLEIPVLKMEPFDPQTAEISFEPYHTVDYFASQGIRFREEEKPRDKFGQQLKSFTEWLKLLKTAPAAETAVLSTPAAEQKVEQLAAHSLAEREVVTEAMAEVWEKQGKHDKAVAIYHKLSLLNPSKSSYFAAKIDQLKQT